MNRHEHREALQLKLRNARNARRRTSRNSSLTVAISNAQKHLIRSQEKAMKKRKPYYTKKNRERTPRNTMNKRLNKKRHKEKSTRNRRGKVRRAFSYKPMDY